MFPSSDKQVRRKVIDPWHDSTNAWVDMYAESVRNAAKVTEYWIENLLL